MPGKIFRISLILLLGTIIHSCIGEFEKPLPESIRLRPTIAIPLINADLNIENSLVLLGYPQFDLDTIDLADFDTIYLIDTLSLALSDIQDTVEVITFLEFKIALWNDFPSYAELQVYFIDDNLHQVDSLFYPNMFQIVNGIANPDDGKVIKRGFSTTSIIYEPGRIEKLKPATRAVLHSRISNMGVSPEHFDYYKDYSLSVKIGARIGIDYIFDL